MKVFGGGGSMQRRRVLMKGLRWKESESYKETDKRKRERVLP